jgi:hypothetical protein
MGNEKSIENWNNFDSMPKKSLKTQQTNEIIIYNKSSYYIDIYFYIDNRLISKILNINDTILHSFDNNFNKIEIYNKDTASEIRYRVFNITEYNKIIYADGRYDSIVTINDKYNPWTLIYNIVPRRKIHLINNSCTNIIIIDEDDEHKILESNNDIILKNFKYIITKCKKNPILDVKRNCFEVYNDQAYIQNRYYSDDIVFECEDKKEMVKIIATQQ